MDVKYIDITDLAVYDYPQIADMIQNKELNLPVVMLNERILGTGYVSYPMILKELAVIGLKAIN